MFYVVKFGGRLHAATKTTVLAVQSGVTMTAVRTAPAMAGACAHLAMEALQKAQGAFIQGNDQIYLALAQQAQAFAEAGAAISQSIGTDGTVSFDQYQEGARKINWAVSLLG